MTVAICFRGAKVHIKIHTLTFFCKNFQIFFIYLIISILKTNIF